MRNFSPISVIVLVAELFNVGFGAFFLIQSPGRSFVIGFLVLQLCLMLTTAIISSRGNEAHDKTNSEAAVVGNLISGLPGVVVVTDAELRIVAVSDKFVTGMKLPDFPQF
jgi:hypothetical protein